MIISYYINYKHAFNYKNELPTAEVCKNSMNPLGPSCSLWAFPEDTPKVKMSFPLGTSDKNYKTLKNVKILIFKYTYKTAPAGFAKRMQYKYIYIYVYINIYICLYMNTYFIYKYVHTMALIAIESVRFHRFLTWTNVNGISTNSMMPTSFC